MATDVALEGFIGARFDADFKLWADDTHTAPFPNLALYSVEVDVDELGAFTEGAGVTVDTAAGVVSLTIAPALTATVTLVTTFRLWLTERADPTNRFPQVRGSIAWLRP